MTQSVLCVARRIAALALCTLACLAPTGCVPGPDGPEDSFGIDFPPASEGPTVATTRPAAGAAAKADGALIFIVDGVGSATFDDMLAAGELPAVQKYFVGRGLYVPRAVANTPSVTMANLTSLVTGRFPGHHGITGINWFDRNGLIWRNYETIAQKNTLDQDYQAKTLYEHFPDRTTFSVFYQAHRGATKFIENWTSAGPPFFFGWYEFLDRLTLYRLGIVADVVRRRGRWPAVTVCYLLAPDFEAYDHGVRSEDYRRAIRHADRQIGRVLGDLSRAGRLERIVLALTSDHSLGEVTKHFPLAPYLAKAGLRIAPDRLFESTAFEDRLARYSQSPAVLYGSGERYWAVCLRKPVYKDGNVTGYEPWPVRPAAADLRSYPLARPKNHVPASHEQITPDGRHVRRNLTRLLCRAEAVRAVAWREAADRVRLATRAGAVEFTQAASGRPIAYRDLTGSDPLGWSGKVPADLLRGRPADGRAWLEATHDTDWPDLPAQILAYFRARRAGDLAVFAAEGWDFGRRNRAGHGGLHPSDVHVPLLLAGPGVPHGTKEVARTVDLMPTILALLGRPVPGDLDGRPLCPAGGK